MLCIQLLHSETASQGNYSLITRDCIMLQMLAMTVQASQPGSHIERGVAAPELDGGDVVRVRGLLLGRPAAQVDLLAAQAP